MRKIRNKRKAKLSGKDQKEYLKRRYGAYILKQINDFENRADDMINNSVLAEKNTLKK